MWRFALRAAPGPHQGLCPQTPADAALRAKKWVIFHSGYRGIGPFWKVNCVADCDGVQRTMVDLGEQWRSPPEKFKFSNLADSATVCHSPSWSATIRRTSPQSARVSPYGGLRQTVVYLNCPLESVKVEKLTWQIIRQKNSLCLR